MPVKPLWIIVGPPIGAFVAPCRKSAANSGPFFECDGYTLLGRYEVHYRFPDDVYRSQREAERALALRLIQSEL